jgi:hypothetical protein
VGYSNQQLNMCAAPFETIVNNVGNGHSTTIVMTNDENQTSVHNVCVCHL